MIMETPDNARFLSGVRKDAERIRSQRKKDTEKKDNPEDIEQARQITELVELHFDGTIDTQEELAEKLSELLDRPITISKDPYWWDFGADSYTASYEATSRKKKRVIGFLRFTDPKVVREKRRQEKKKQEKKERIKQRKLDRARDASYCLMCHQSLD